MESNITGIRLTTVIQLSRTAQLRVAATPLYLQDEVQFAFHPTLTLVWCLKERRGQRARGSAGRKPASVYGFGLVDSRDGGFYGRREEVLGSSCRV
jgi:hypothetical protein